MKRKFIGKRWLENVILAAFRGTRPIHPFSREHFLLEFGAFQNRLEMYFYREDQNDLCRLIEDCERLLAIDESLEKPYSVLQKFLQDSARHLSRIQAPSDSRRPWSCEKLSPAVQHIPGMLHEDTRRYYKWLGQNYEGWGVVVELGCWFGSSTACLIDGLKTNSSFSGKHMHVFDSFRWRDWMRPYAAALGVCVKHWRDGKCFLEDFRRNTRRASRSIVTHVTDIHPNSKASRSLRWTGDPIELFVYDLSDDYTLTTAVWSQMCASFRPGTTIVFNQYGNKNAVGLRDFILEKQNQLQPLHKPLASTKSFTFVAH